MAAEYEANTRTLLGQGVAGPMLPGEAGFHDALVRKAHYGDDAADYKSDRTYVGPGTNWDQYRDSAVHSTGMGFMAALSQEGDPRLGGASTKYGAGRMGSDVTEQDYEAARNYEKGVRNAQITELETRRTDK
jgi:hypothetical protein